ncbi:hypothetical protein F2Q68_00001454 [Brassica cretica]|uniref:Uncharacterized protein n=1 Tax=Brassica cretica TaxID=69181 RepID=A0A8S9JF64_BRACR|nr:hypothetical protein F2Q68_00001454 [Brassica cretica]
MTEENAKEREDNAGGREIMRNDEDGTMDETQTQSHDLRNIEEPFDSVKNVEGSVVVRDERGEIESAETMVETEKKDFKEGYHYKKTAAYRGKKASKFPTKFRGNKFSRKLRGPPVRQKGPRNIPRENFLGIFRWTFRWSNLRKFRRNVPQNFHRKIPRKESLCIFRRLIPRKCSSEISEGSFPRNFKKN